ncbi:MAG: glycosyltransferase [Ignavibacteriaceae bacterium]|nr:glycosyltransferase [Ignavibacteriaceae bacterium]
MKLSIVIPTLNEEKLLPVLLSQLQDVRRKYSNTEIIVSDGGSKDNTLQIAKEFECKIVNDNSVNGNIASGRNFGAAHSSGDILLFINADIRFKSPESFFDYAYNQFLTTGCAAMTCYVTTFPEESRIADKLFHTFYNAYFILLNKIGVGMGRGECQLVKKDIFESVGGYNIHLAAGEDFDLFRRIKNSGNKILFNTGFTVFESPRRYRKLGYIGVALLWTKNAVSILLKNKSISKVWEQVR